MGNETNTPSPHSPRGPGDTDSTKPAPVILDAEQLEQLREMPGSGEGTLLDDLIEIVRRDIPPDLARLQVLVQQRASAEVAQLAHRVAGSAASLGGVALRQVLHTLEQAGRKSDWPAADRISATLEQEWQITLKALQMNSSRPPA